MKILSFGEILWDIFGDKREIGGAPFNFAAHCANLGAKSFLISAVGNDQNGSDALEIAKSKGINCDFIASTDFKTGCCNVSLRDGIPFYDLERDVAYDHIPCPDIKTDCDVLYMGTLAMRSPCSLNSFNSLAERVNAREVLFDVNFRGDFYSKELVFSLLGITTVLKISDEEIGFFGSGSHEEICKNLAAQFPKLKYICLTLGKNGAMALDCKKGELLISDRPKSKPISTVGAGDSFAAAFIVNLVGGATPLSSLNRAVSLSDYVVTQLGAVPDYKPFRSVADSWNLLI